MSEMQADVGRNTIWIIATVVAVIVGGCYVAYGYFAAGSTAAPSVVAINTAGKGTASTESEHYGKVLNKYNQSNATNAEQKGETYVSVISTRDQPVQESHAPKDAIPEQQKQPQVVYVYQPSPQQNGGQRQPEVLSDQEKERRERIRSQAAALIKNWGGSKHSVASATDESSYAGTVNIGVSSGANVPPGAHPSTGQTTNSVPIVKILDDFVRIPALLGTDLDTDENSVVFAVVPSGPYEGLTVIAQGYKRINESIDMTFTIMKWRGRSYKVTAKAIDQNTLRSALSGEVNNRYFTRIILPAIAAGIGKTGQMYEQSSAQNIITPQGGVIQTYPSTPNGTAVLGTMIGGAGETAGKVLAQDAAQMPTKQVLIAKGGTIGIQFMAPVLSTDDLTASATAPAVDLNTLGQPASQPPAQVQQQPPAVRPAGYPITNLPAAGLYPSTQGGYSAY
ncbi:MULTISPECIES: conjugal transfer protein TraO [unclassified Pseudomonas]|uniref:conjugal transfer protein TraO n=1 Tax=unclassified Pseudomonas TaxID=196821 RepID=UPI0012FD1FF5|nr:MULTISPECIES: conjugal transfer protein TraO [unclassified Pseudomonas]MCU1737530.1 conjugal transfer protein TraO [Pseudomonas sp. 20S_6.2_Bac1]